MLFWVSHKDKYFDIEVKSERHKTVMIIRGTPACEDASVCQEYKSSGQENGNNS